MVESLPLLPHSKKVLGLNQMLGGFCLCMFFHAYLSYQNWFCNRLQTRRHLNTEDYNPLTFRELEIMPLPVTSEVTA